MGLRWEDVLICGAAAIGVGLLSGNLLYLAVTYTPREIMKQLVQGRFQLFQEGFVFYGGMAGGFAGVFLGAAAAHCKAGTVLEAALPAVPFAHGIGRMGCLLAGCCHGMPYTGPLAVPDRVTGILYFPVQLLEAVSNGIIGLYLILLVKQRRGARDLLRAYLLIYSCARFTLEFLRGDEVRGVALGLSTSQWISAAVIIACLFTMKRKRAG